MYISIIIPTYNNLEECLKPCLESIKKFTNLDNIEVVVVANGCKEDTEKYLDLPENQFVTTLWFDQPLGYTKAINAGINFAKGDYLILLNDDTVLLDQPNNLWVNMLLQPFLEDEKVAVTGPMKKWNEETKSHFLIFFCVMIKRKIFNKIGNLDEIFNPGYGEDIDFCVKAQRKDFKIVQVPDTNNKIDEDKKFLVGGFPIYHGGERTVHKLGNYEDIVRRNTKILEERYLEKWQPYPLTEEQINIKGLKLHLGCSWVYLNDFINIDIDSPVADMDANVSKLPMFKDNTAALIVNSHLIEHFNKVEAMEAVKEWHRVLMPGGWLITEGPDMEKCFRIYLNSKDDAEREATLGCIYGSNWYNIYMAHLWGYRELDIINMMRKVGFSYAVPNTPIQHSGKYHNFRVDAKK